jgi:hypothetical protein
MGASFVLPLLLLASATRLLRQSFVLGYHHPMTPTVEAEEIEGIQTLPIVVSVDQVQVKDIPEKVQQFLCLMAMGFSAASIAKLAKCDPDTVKRSVAKYDPERKFTMTSADKRSILSQLWQARATEALLSMTPEKIEACSATQLAIIATRGCEMAEKGAQKADKPKDPVALISALTGATEEVSSQDGAFGRDATPRLQDVQAPA